MAFVRQIFNTFCVKSYDAFVTITSLLYSILLSSIESSSDLMDSVRQIFSTIIAKLYYAFVTIRNHFSGEETISNYHHSIFAFTFPTLLTFLQLKYAGKVDSPFDMHPKAMAIAIASFLIYCLGFDGELRISLARLSPTYPNVVGYVVTFFGYVSVASLASILFPDLVQPFLFLLFALSLAGLLHLVQKRLVGENGGFNNLSRRIKRIFTSVFMDSRDILPVSTNL